MTNASIDSKIITIAKIIYNWEVEDLEGFAKQINETEWKLSEEDLAKAISLARAGNKLWEVV